jgi:glycosyltransferase involved in cell wall biosynthesis
MASASLSQARKTISIVAPFYDESGGIERFYRAIVSAIDSVPAVRFEVVCVDDVRRDDTLPKPIARTERDRRFRVVELSRNFGKEAALTAGINIARGGAVVPIDGDLQDPPAAASAHLYLRLASWEDHLAPISRWDEFGLPSSCQPRVAASMAWLLTNVEGIAAGRDVAAVLPHNGTIAKLPADSCIVDLSVLPRRRPVQCEAAVRPGLFCLP